MKEVIKNKKNIIIIIALIIIILLSTLIILKNKEIKTDKLDNKDIVEKQEEVINIIKKYVDNKEEIREYAKENSKIEFSIKELEGIFKIDVSEFKKLKYSCSLDNTFIKYNNDYSKYIVILDCKDFYL